MGKVRWWEQDDRPPEWWPFAPLPLVEAARCLARASDELRWDADTFINEPLDRRLWALWRRTYWSKYPATGQLPEPLTFPELRAELRPCFHALGHLQAAADEVTLDRLGRVMDYLQAVEVAWKRWDAKKNESG